MIDLGASTKREWTLLTGTVLVAVIVGLSVSVTFKSDTPFWPRMAGGGGALIFYVALKLWCRFKDKH
jgi:hypothetical protein